MKPSNVILVGLVFTMLGGDSASAAAAVSPDVTRAAQQYREFLVGGKVAGQASGGDGNLTLSGTDEAIADPHDALKFARTLGPDGHWPDIDYESASKSDWPPGSHCQRILAMAAMGVSAGVTPEDRKQLIAATHRAFEYWIKSDLQSKNWWNNQIGVPKSLGSAALLLGDQLTLAEFGYVTKTLLPRAKIAMTGQNRVWLAGNTLVLGLLTGDRATVDRAAKVVWDEVRITEQEGLQPDFSFHQHGPQQQFGNYGMAFAVEECKWGQVLRGTPWAMSAEKLAIFRDYLLNGQNWVTYRGEYDISSCGRQLEPDRQRSKAQSMMRVMRCAASFDVAHAAEYLAFIERNTSSGANDLIGNISFWRSDFVVHRRREFCVTLKMHSARTIGSESLNGENLAGYYLADGATYFCRSGDEYENIFPLWDWNKLPGVTCPQSSAPPAAPSAANLKTERTFVGGVSDGTFGCAALDLDRDGLAAHKAWFFGEDVVYCLGAGIHSSDEKSIATTINQCLLRGPVMARSAGKEAALPAGNRELQSAEWLEHDGWRYTFPEAVTIREDSGPRTGNWHHVFNNPATPVADVRRDLFTLWIDHGVKPGAASYAYAVSAAGRATAAEMLSNTDAVQAVSFDDDHVGVVFWKPGHFALPNGQALDVDQACALLVNRSTRHLTVSDPTHQLQSATVSAMGVRKTISFPSAGDAGKSVDVELR